MKVKWENEIVLCTLIFIMGQAFVKGGNPFVLAAFVAAVGTGINAKVAATASLLGVIAPVFIKDGIGLAEILPVLITIAVSVCIMIGSTYTNIIKKRQMLAGVLCTGVAYTCAQIILSGLGLRNIAMPIVMCGMALIFNKGFEAIKSGTYLRAGSEEFISIIIILLIAVVAIPEWQSEYFSLKMTLLMFLILWTAFCHGVASAALCGVLCAVAISDSDVQLFMYAGIFAFAGIGAGLVAKLGRGASSISFCIIIMMFYLYIMRDGQEIFDIDIKIPGASLCAGILFALLPLRGIIINSRNEKKIANEEAGDNIRKYTRSQLYSISSELKLLSEKISENTETRQSLNQQEMDGVMQDVTMTMCSNCDNRQLCWDENYGSTMQAMGSVFGSVMSSIEGCDNDRQMQLPQFCHEKNELITRTRMGLYNARMNMRWLNQMAQVKEALSKQINEISTVLSDCAANMLEPVRLNYRQRTRLARKLLAAGVYSDEVCVLRQRDGHIIVTVNARSDLREKVSIKKLQEVLTECIGIAVIAGKNEPDSIDEFMRTYNFYQQTTFKIMTGVARLAKGKTNVNGDNYTFIDTPDKNVIMAIADGMGAGENAYNKSCEVIELLENYADAGFSGQTAVEMINSLMMFDVKDKVFSTIDIGTISRYTGICKFVKAGASYSFIKRKKWVDVISTTSYPIGIINENECDTIVKKLYSGDYVIMVSDGISDCFRDDRIAQLEEFISKRKDGNPGQMAKDILDFSAGKQMGQVQDDMTVLVAGIWKRH